MIAMGSKIWKLREKQLLGAIILLSVLMMAIRLNETPVGANTDDAYYIEMARSIAEGQGPVISTGPDCVAEYPDIFPVGLPLLLSPLAAVFPESVLVLKSVPVFFTLLLIPLCLTIPGREADNKTKLMLTALVILNPWVLAWSGRVLSDIVFTVFSLAALLVFSNLLSEKKVQKRSFVLLIFLSVMAISVRTVGWAVVVTICLTLLGRRHFLQALGFLISVVLLMLPVWLFQSGDMSPITGAYWTQMMGSDSHSIWPLISHNFLHYLAELPVLLVPLFGGPAESAMVSLGLGGLYFPVAVAFGIALIGLMSAAVLRYWNHCQWSALVQVFSIYILVYGVVLLNFDGYPSGVQTRLLLPVLPIMAWFIVLTIRHAARGNARNLAVLVFGVMIVASLIHNGWRMANPLHSSVDASGHGYVDPAVGSNWIKVNTERTDIVMVQETLHRHLHFYRGVVAFPQELSEANLDHLLDEFDVGYVFVGPSVHGLPRQLDEQGTSMLKLLKSMPKKFKVEEINTEDNFYIFSRVSKKQKG